MKFLLIDGSTILILTPNSRFFYKKNSLVIDLYLFKMLSNQAPSALSDYACLVLLGDIKFF